MKIRHITAMALTCILAMGALGCTPVKRGEYAKGSAKVFCDDGFRNILDEEIEVFEYSYPEASIIPVYMGESDAMDSLLHDKVQSIIVTRDLTPDQRKMMKTKYKRIVRSQPIAVDAVALIVNKNNPVTALSLDDVREIMNGRIRTWNQLAGADTTAIKLVFDNPGSSTVSYMRERFLPKGTNISDVANAFGQKDNAEVFDIVKNDKNALGIISVSWLGDNLQAAKKVPVDRRTQNYKNESDTIAAKLTTEVTVLKISNPNPDNDFTTEAYAPYQLYIDNGNYPLFRKVYMISTASNSTVLHSFYTFMTGFVGQKIISLTGIMPYQVNRRMVQLQTQK